MKLKILTNMIALLLITLMFSACAEDEQSKTNAAADSSAVNESNGIPVEVLEVNRKTVNQEVPLTGVMEPINSVDIVAEVSGEILKIEKQLGQYITTADTLAYVDDRIPKSNYEQAYAQVMSAENNLRIAKLNVESDKELQAMGDISKLAYENSVYNYKSAEANLLAAKATLSALEKSYEDTRVTSPINGLISRKHIDVGQMVNNGSPLFRVVDLSVLKLKVGIPQSTIVNVKPGSTAHIIVSGLNNGTFTGYVKNISPQADEATGSFLVEIYLKNTPDNKIRAGMTASVNLIVSAENELLVVPDHAVVTKNGGDYIYRFEEGYAKLTEVKLGHKYGKQVEVLDGLSEGDKIVVVGMKNLGVNTKVWVEKEG